MPLSSAEQNAIILRDMERRHARKLLEDAALGIDVDNQQSDAYKIAHASKDSHVNACLVRSIGVVCPPPKTRASQDCWNRGMKGTTRGVAPGSTDPTPSMLVTLPDGTSYVTEVHNSRATKRKPKTATAQRTPETARINHHHNFND